MRVFRDRPKRPVARIVLFAVAVGGCDSISEQMLAYRDSAPGTTPVNADWLVSPASVGGDQTPPRIISMVPAPGTWIVNNVGLTQIQVAFNEAVTIPGGAITAWTLGGGDVTAFATSYDAGSNVLTISFTPPIRDDRLTLVLDYAITDLAGNALDGEIFAPSSAALPSGNGKRGGQAVFRVNVLQGDVNRDASTDALDGALLSSTLGQCDGDPLYYANADLNGDGCINVLDVAIFTLAEGRTLPVTDGTSPMVTQVVPDPASALGEDVDEVTISFSEAIDAARFNERTGYYSHIE